jgi:Protein of unknown function (DUF2971)
LIEARPITHPVERKLDYTMFDFRPKKPIPEEEHNAIFAKTMQLVLAQYGTRAVPEILYHYTDAAGLKGIVESGVLRATHIAFTNDASEYLHASSLLVERVKLEKARATDPLRLSVLAEMEKWIATRPEGGAPYFVACFSAKENSLNQWRAYGRGEGGFSIGFDGPGLSAQVLKDGRDFIAPAIYDRDEQANMIRVFLDWVLDEYPRVARRHAAAEQDEHRSAWTHMMLWMVAAVAPMMKNSAFFEEEEWRLIHLTHSQASVRFLPKPTGLVPFVELKLGIPQSGAPDQIALLGRNLPDRLPIKVLWSGPGRATDTSLLAGRTLLEQCGYDGVRLAASKIPYRVG